MGTKLTLTQQDALAARKAEVILSFVGQHIATRSREGTLPLCSVLLRPHLERWVQFWAPQSTRDLAILEEVQPRSMKMVDWSIPPRGKA